MAKLAALCIKIHCEYRLEMLSIFQEQAFFPLFISKPKKESQLGNDGNRSDHSSCFKITIILCIKYRFVITIHLQMTDQVNVDTHTKHD